MGVQPGRGSKCNEKLASVRAGSPVGHRKETGTVEFQVRTDFILEIFAVDARAPASGSGRISALNHEVVDHAVEADAVVVSFLREAFEVLDGLRRLGVEELYFDVSHGRFDNHYFLSFLIRRLHLLLPGRFG